MKSLTAVCQTGASMPAMNPNGRIARHPHQRGDGENAEMKMYLSKLKDLVPFMPKNRKLSKLEIIQHVIDYICDLQTELETHPEIGNFDAAAALNYNDDDDNEDDDNDDDDVILDDASSTTTAQSALEDHIMLAERLSSAADQQQSQQHSSSPATMRQPLVDRQAPNTILPSTVNHNTLTIPTTTVNTVQQQQQQQQYQQHLTLATAQNSQTQTVEKDSRQSC